jgi:hypothetical protein
VKCGAMTMGDEIFDLNAEDEDEVFDLSAEDSLAHLEREVEQYAASRPHKEEQKSPMRRDHDREDFRLCASSASDDDDEWGCATMHLAFVAIPEGCGEQPCADAHVGVYRPSTPDPTPSKPTRDLHARRPAVTRLPDTLVRGEAVPTHLPSLLRRGLRLILQPHLPVRVAWVERNRGPSLSPRLTVLRRAQATRGRRRAYRPG